MEGDLDGFGVVAAVTLAFDERLGQRAELDGHPRVHEELEAEATTLRGQEPVPIRLG